MAQSRMAARRKPEASLARLALVFGAIFLAGLALRLYALGAKPFWIDEVTTLHRASLPPGRLIGDSLRHHQLPAFFVVTAWVLPFGTDEFWLRLPAAILGALSCALCFGIACDLGGLKAGLAAGLLAATAPAMVQYGQEARSYTAVICAILVGLWGLLALARKESRGGWAAYVLGTLAALNILSVAIFWLLGANLAGAFLAWRRDQGFRRRWLLAQAAIIALSLPWFIAMQRLGEHGALGGINWVPALNPAVIWWSFSGTYLFYVTSLIRIREFSPILPGFGVLVALLAAFGLAALRRRPAEAVVLLIAVLCLPVSLLLVSIAVPVLMPRYLLWGAAPYFICAGLGLTMSPKPAQWPALAALLLLSAVNLAPYYHAETKSRWDLAAKELQTGMRPGDVLLTDDPQTVELINLCLPPGGAPLPAAISTTDLAQALAWQRGGRRVWAVAGAVGQFDEASKIQFAGRIAALGPPQWRTRLGLDIVLLRFAPE